MNEYLEKNMAAYYPYLVDEAIEIVETGPSELLVRLADGSAYLYDDFDQIARPLPRDSDNMTEMECRTEFSARLRRTMLLKGVSQNELADRTGITRPMINRYMTGKSEPGFYNLDKIARALGCSLEEFRYLE
jgi:DNA-binding Xre family transcriptional regulator